MSFPVNEDESQQSKTTEKQKQEQEQEHTPFFHISVTKVSPGNTGEAKRTLMALNWAGSLWQRVWRMQEATMPYDPSP